MTLPSHASEIDVETFNSWAKTQGFEVRRPTNPWELIRIADPVDGVQILYKNKKGRLSWTGPSLTTIYQRFQESAQ